MTYVAKIKFDLTTTTRHIWLSSYFDLQRILFPVRHFLKLVRTLISLHYQCVVVGESNNTVFVLNSKQAVRAKGEISVTICFPCSY